MQFVQQSLKNENEIKQLLTPNIVAQWSLDYANKIMPKLLSDENLRCVILTYNSTASLVRKLKGSPNDNPIDISHISLADAFKIYPRSQTLKICQDDPSKKTYAIIVGTYLPISMFGGQNDKLSTFSITALKIK